MIRIFIKQKLAAVDAFYWWSIQSGTIFASISDYKIFDLLLEYSMFLVINELRDCEIFFSLFNSYFFLPSAGPADWILRDHKSWLLFQLFKSYSSYYRAANWLIHFQRHFLFFLLFSFFPFYVKLSFRYAMIDRLVTSVASLLTYIVPAADGILKRNIYLLVSITREKRWKFFANVSPLLPPRRVNRPAPKQHRHSDAVESSFRKIDKIGKKSSRKIRIFDAWGHWHSR